MPPVDAGLGLANRLAGVVSQRLGRGQPWVGGKLRCGQPQRVLRPLLVVRHQQRQLVGAALPAQQQVAQAAMRRTLGSEAIDIQIGVAGAQV